LAHQEASKCGKDRFLTKGHSCGTFEATALLYTRCPPDHPFRGPTSPIHHCYQLRAFTHATIQIRLETQGQFHSAKLAGPISVGSLHHYT
jgi:hypothetical protein